MDFYKLFKSRCSKLIKENSNCFNYSILEDYDNFKDLMTEEEFKDVLRIKHNRLNKRSRTKSKISDMLSYYAFTSRKRKLYLVFGTGTIDNDYLWKRQPRTRDKLLNIYLLNHYDVALVNKDFGDKTDREHYHWIGLTSLEPIPKLDNEGNQVRSKKGFPLYVLPTSDYRLGYNPTVEPIVTTDMDKIRNYLLKLNNHSNKETAQRLRHIKSTNYRLWDLLENDNHQKETFKKVRRKLKKEGLVI